MAAAIWGKIEMVVAVILIVMSRVVPLIRGLSMGYYDMSCPHVDLVVREAVQRAMESDNRVGAALLRMHFHDCFIRGCDGSVLIDSSGGNQAEKDGPPNRSLHAFFVIDNAKANLESLCPATVSCADILALAARDVVALSGGPNWEVPTGRKDGRISVANDTQSLPAPTFNVSQLIQAFSQRGLSVHDLVALSGGHTLGFSHCSSFQNRIHNFDSKHQVDVDPALHPLFAQTLRNVCPAGNTQRNAGASLDSTTNQFDNQYFKHLLQGKGLFTSDQALYSDARTNGLVRQFAIDQNAFFDQFVNSMLKMSSILLPSQSHSSEVRLNCRKLN